jgi:hypothetical protein
MAIGQELLDIPFADMVTNLASAIAEGQLELDRSAIETLKFLVATKVDLIPEITEVIEPAPKQVEVGPSGAKKIIPYTGANITASGAAPVTMNLLQAGLMPTFYQFTEASLEVKLSISIKRTEETEPVSGSSNPGPVKYARLALYKTKAFASPVNYRTSSTYSYTAEGSSVLRATMKPVPPPPRLTPRTVTVNAFTTPPTVTITD